LLFDQLLGQFQLLCFHIRLGDVDFGGGAHFSREVQLLHREHIADRAERHEIGLAAGRPTRHSTTFSVLQCFIQQAVGFCAALVGREVVGLVEVHRIDGLDGHELGDVDRVGADLFHGFDFFAAELDVLVLGELVALHHVVALDHLAILETDVLLFQARATSLV
jgi:hypothetical protein